MKGDDKAGSLVPVVVQVSGDFQLNVLEKLGRLEAMMDMLVGNGQPGRMRLVEDRIMTLERNDIKRNVYDTIVTAVIAFVVSGVIALHDRLWPK
ncbi:MAG: hypothetical protein ACRD3Q_03735 [Terriglobales bacterium]